MIPETENQQEVKNVCLGQPARDPGRYATQGPQCWLSCGTANWRVLFEFELSRVRHTCYVKGQAHFTITMRNLNDMYDKDFKYQTMLTDLEYVVTKR